MSTIKVMVGGRNLFVTHCTWLVTKRRQRWSSGAFHCRRLTPREPPSRVVATLTVSGNGFNGTGPMTFEFRDGLISRLVISPTG